MDQIDQRRGFFLLDIPSCGVQSHSIMFQYLDFWVSAGFALTVLAFLLCLLYGVIKWNKGYQEKDGDYREEIRWEREEIELIERLP